MARRTTAYRAVVLSAMITGEFLPLTEDLQALVSPARFRDRQARRGYKFGATG